MLAAARRELVQPKKRKEQFKRGVALMVKKLTDKRDCLRLRPAVIFAVGYAGFMRWSYMENIKVEDTTFYSKQKKRKNDQFREGSVILIHQQNSLDGPVNLYEQLIVTVHLKTDPYLLSNIVWPHRETAHCVQKLFARLKCKGALERGGLDFR